MGSVKIDNGSAWLNTWWPIAGNRFVNSGALVSVGNYAHYWSSTYTSTYNSYYLYFRYDGTVNPSNSDYRSTGFSVRCVQEEPCAKDTTKKLEKRKIVNQK